MNENLIQISSSITIVVLTFIIAFLVNRFFKSLLHRSTEAMKNDPTNYIFLRHASITMIYMVGFSIAIYVLPNLRALASSLLAGAGILAISVGLASQHALSNILSGLFIVISKPFRVNDRLQIRNFVGIVEDITLRHTVIRDFENKRIVIPNTLISDEIIINSDFAEDKICRWIDIRISFDSDLDKAKAIMSSETMKHPLHLDPRSTEDIKNGKPEVSVRVISLGESAINLRAWAWAKDASDAFILSCDLFESIKKRFDEEGIEIPYPHYTIHQKK